MQDLIHRGVAGPGLAAKIYSLMNFLEQKFMTQFGCAGLSSLNSRQHEREVQLNLEIRQSFELILAVLGVKPQRRFWLAQPPCRRFIAASDAAEELPKAGTLVWENNDRQGSRGFRGGGYAPPLPPLDAGQQEDRSARVVHVAVCTGGQTELVPASPRCLVD